MPVTKESFSRSALAYFIALETKSEIGGVRCVGKKWAPSPSIYRPEHQRKMEWNTPGMASRTNGQAPRGSVGSTDPRSVRPILGSADPRWAPLRVCFLRVVVLWALKSVTGVHMFLRQFRRSGGPMDPCEVHVSRSNLSGLASLGLVTWHACLAPEVACLACMAPEVTAIPWGDMAWIIEGEFPTSVVLIFLQSHNLQGQVELHYS
jgi:hypothetical protein